MKVAILGDTHGDKGVSNQEPLDSGSSISKACLKAQSSGIDTLIQVGDFGFWGDGYLEHVSKVAQVTGVHVYWLKGNHENHDLIDSITDLKLGGQFEMANKVTFCETGSPLMFGDKLFVIVGGAFSVDMPFRTSGIDWFPQEQISDFDVDWVIRNFSTCDVLLTHDAPNLDLARICPDSWDLPPNIEETSLRQRLQLQKVADWLKPKLHVHGHYHHHHVTDVPYGKVVGLSEDGRRGSYMELDCETLEFKVIDIGSAFNM